MMRLRPVAQSDCDLLFAWQQIPEIRRFFRHTAVPTQAEHEQWFARLLVNKTPFWIINLDERPIGYVRLDFLKGSAITDLAEISVMIIPDYQGRGLAKCALEQVLQTGATNCWVAEIHPNNTASIALFKSLGFQFWEANRYRYFAGSPHVPAG